MRARRSGSSTEAPSLGGWRERREAPNTLRDDALIVPGYNITATGNHGDSTDSVSGNFFDGLNGQNESLFGSGTSACGTNSVGASPGFAHPVAPGAPSCSTYASVPTCIASIIADFKPSASGTSGFGYQVPTSTYTSDPLFPAWLCNTGLPPGLVSNHCQ